MKTPIRFKAETKYQEAVAKKANTNLPIMARVGNHAAGVAAVPGRPSWYYIRIGDGTTGLSPNRLTQCKAEGIGLVLNDYIYVIKARDRNLTYYKFHSFIQNSAGTSPYPTTLIIPDNVAQAYSIVDDDSAGAGSPEYLRIVSTDGGQAVEFNFNNDDVDFIVNANALANAFVLDGAAGGITLAGPSLTVPDDWWWGLGPATSRMEIEGTGVNRFIIYSANLEMTGDDIWIPDNTADAMHIADQAAGVEGLEYQRFVTTNANPNVAFFPSGGGLVSIGAVSINTDRFFEIDASIAGSPVYGAVISPSTPTAAASIYALGLRADVDAGVGAANSIGLNILTPVLGGGATVGTIYGVYVSALAAGTINNWAIYTLAPTRSYFGGDVSIGTVNNLAQLTVDQSGAAGAQPVVLLDQADLSEEFIEFTATVGAGNPIDTAAIGTYYGKVRVSVTGVGFKYMALYNS